MSVDQSSTTERNVRFPAIVVSASGLNASAALDQFAHVHRATFPEATFQRVGNNVTVVGPAWPFYVREAVALGLKVALAEPTPQTVALSLTAGRRFVGNLPNEVALPEPATRLWDPASSRCLVVSSLVRSLMYAWLGKTRAAESVKYVPVCSIKCHVVTEAYFVAIMSKAEADRVMSLASGSCSMQVPTLFPSITVNGAPHDKVKEVLDWATRPTLLFTMSRTDTTPTPRIGKLFTVKADPRNSTVTNINAGDFGCAVFEAVGLVARQEEELTRIRSISVTKLVSDTFNDEFADMRRSGEYGLMWPLSTYGYPDGYYVVRNDVLAFAINLAADMDVLAFYDFGSDRSLVRFGHPWARAALIAECKWKIEHVAHSPKPLQLKTRTCDPEAALAHHTALNPIIAVDARETRMKDDAFQCYWDASTQLVVLRCLCATPLHENDLTAPFLQSPLLQQAKENVSSSHNGVCKKDMIQDTHRHSLSLFHSSRERRKVIIVESRFDPHREFTLVTDGEHAPSIKLGDATIDVELSSGVTDEWACEVHHGLEKVLRQLEAAPDSAIAVLDDILAQGFVPSATHPNAVDSGMPVHVRRSLVLLRLLARHNPWIGAHEELKVTGHADTEVEEALGAQVTQNYGSYRALIKLPRHQRALLEDDGFSAFPNRVFAATMNQEIGRRYGMGLYYELQSTFDADVTQKMLDFVATTTDDPRLREALRSGRVRAALTRQEVRHLVFTVPGVSQNMSMTDILAALHVTDPYVAHSFVQAPPIQPLEQGVYIQTTELADVVCLPTPPRALPRSLLDGTSALRKWSHLLAQYLVLLDPAQTPPAEVVREELERTATAVKAFAEDQGVHDTRGIIAFMNDTTIPLEKKAVPVGGMVTGTSTAYIPTLDWHISFVEAAQQAIPPSPRPLLSKVTLIARPDVTTASPTDTDAAGLMSPLTFTATHVQGGLETLPWWHRLIYDERE
jgi:hypothetical protein